MIAIGYNARITQRMYAFGTFWFSFSEGKVLTRA